MGKRLERRDWVERRHMSTNTEALALSTRCGLPASGSWSWQPVSVAIRYSAAKRSWENTKSSPAAGV